VQVTRAHLERLPLFRHDSRLERLPMGGELADAGAAGSGMRGSAATLVAMAAAGSSLSLSHEEMEAVVAAAAAGGTSLRLMDEDVAAAVGQPLQSDLLVAPAAVGASAEEKPSSRALLNSVTASDDDDDASEAALRAAFVSDLLLATLCQPVI